LITVIFTCYNRRKKTINCIKSLVEGNPSVKFSFVVLDDNSTDGTAEALREFRERSMAGGSPSGSSPASDAPGMAVLHGDGSSYWAGGMRKAIAYAKTHTASDYYLLVNDDVEFADGAIERLLAEYAPHTALVGPMSDKNGNFSYGGVRYTNGIHYEEVKPDDKDRSCDTFNMNCLLVDRDVFMETPNFDEHYIHTLADFDYGLSMKRNGIRCFVASGYVGICPKNASQGGWTDRSLSRRERMKQKESIKGAPFGPWFHFLKKNFGIRQAVVYSATPYIRILLGK
jgi:GT2 family glycosyltransferase